MILKASEVKEATSEQLIHALVMTGVTTAHNGGRMSQALVASEKRIVKELCERFNLDEAKLTELLNQ